jgi:peptidoglycan/xylan/chitin deacetylase (PgdA/CDA1 family)
MAYWHISNWTKKIYPDVLWDRSNTGKKLYLTFDDGPTPVVTEMVLDILDKYNAKATFFCLGRNVERHPELYKEILKRGHQTGNHTYSHLKGWEVGNKEYFQDIELARQFIDSGLFRPPYGRIKRAQIKYLKKKYQIVLWDVMSHDYEKLWTRERCLRAVMRYTKEGSIIVFHDSEKAAEKVAFILPRLLDTFKEKGYSFETISGPLV